MARLWSSGFELAASGTDVEWSSAPGLAAGSGLSEFYGESGVTSQTAGDDLFVTSEDPGGTLDVVVVYKIVS